MAIDQTDQPGGPGLKVNERDRLAPAGWYRHPADLARLLVALAITIAIGVVVGVYPEGVLRVSTSLVALASTLPAWLTTFLVGFLQLLAFLVPIVVVAVLLVRRRFAVLALVALATALAVMMIVVGGWLIDDDRPALVQENQKLDSWFTGRAYPSGMYLAAVAAVVVAAGPFLRRSWRRAAWVGVAAAAFLRLLTATEVPINLTVGIAIGAMAGSLALLILGAPPQRLDPELLRSVLSRLGLAAGAITPLSRDRGSPTARAHTPDGDAYVRVLGREERDTDILLRTWQGLRVKGLGDDRPSGTIRAVAENAALAESLAAGAGARVPAVLGVTSTDVEGAMVLVDEFVEGVPLAAMNAEDIGDDLLADVWEQVAALHRRRIAHRWMDAKHVRVSDGQAVIVDFRSAVIAARDELLAADVVELLASLSAIVGVDRAVESAHRALGPQVLAGALPLVQPVVLRPRSRAEMKAAKGRIDELRTAVQHAAGVEKIELAPIQRITLKGVVSLVGSAVLGYYLISLATDWQDIWATMKTADLASIPFMVALVVGAYVGGAVSLMGSVNNQLAFGRTTQVMFGQSFLNRFTPANAGGMALRARYLQLSGTDLTVAAAAVGLTSAASGVVQIVFLVVFAVWGGATGAFSSISLPSVPALLLVLVLVAAIIGAIVLSTWGRRAIVPWVRRTWRKAYASFRELAKRPSKMGQLFGGATFAKLSTVVAFVVSVHAFGVDMSFPRAAALYMVASSIGAAVPTPGGVGGIEAALTAALITAGVADATAASIVLYFRLWTFWLPTIPGWFFLRRIQRQGIV